MIIPDLGAAAVDGTYELWDAIVASEYFPAGAGATGANYVLTLSKSVNQVGDVRRVEDILLQVMQMLASAWLFAGGSSLTVETREVANSPRFTSNANELESRTLVRHGLQSVASFIDMPLGWGATYSKPPLRLAVCIAKLMHSDTPTRRLLSYYQSAITKRGDASSWFIDLYKVRDFLCKLYGCEKKVRSALGISKNQWKYFGGILNNNDLRHAEIGDHAVTVLDADKRKVYHLARLWISSYLQTKGIACI